MRGHEKDKGAKNGQDQILRIDPHRGPDDTVDVPVVGIAPNRAHPPSVPLEVHDRDPGDRRFHVFGLELGVGAPGECAAVIRTDVRGDAVFVDRPDVIHQVAVRRVGVLMLVGLSAEHQPVMLGRVAAFDIGSAIKSLPPSLTRQLAVGRANQINLAAGPRTATKVRRSVHPLPAEAVLHGCLLVPVGPDRLSGICHRRSSRAARW